VAVWGKDLSNFISKLKSKLKFKEEKSSSEEERYIKEYKLSDGSSIKAFLTIVLSMPDQDDESSDEFVVDYFRVSTDVKSRENIQKVRDEILNPLFRKYKPLVTLVRDDLFSNRFEDDKRSYDHIFNFFNDLDKMVAKYK